jgi:protein SCO1/2
MKNIIVLLFSVVLLTLVGIYVYKQNTGASAGGIMPPASFSQNQLQNKLDPKLEDYTLLDQDGKKIKLYTDLLKNKITVMNFIFTNCKVVCDAQGKRFSQLQAKLVSRMESDVNLISLTKDIENDTPEILKKWGSKYNRKTGWTILTGNKSEMDKTFIAFTGGPPAVIEHTPVILVGNADKNKWIRASGLEPVEEIEKMIERVK